jgi:hypothetical protein
MNFMDGIGYKVLSDKRLKALEEIRAIIKKHIPNAFDRNCVSASLTDVLDSVLAQSAATERARNAFRDALLQRGCTHHDLVGLVENYREENGDH